MRLKEILIEDDSGMALGYKVMAYKDGKLVSLMDDGVTMTPKIGEVHKMGGKGIYLGTTKDFVEDYYTGLTDLDEVILTYKYSLSDVTSGDPHAKSGGEITVSKGQLVDIEHV